MTVQNHGGANFATSKGFNRKIERVYNLRALDYAKMLGQC